MIQDLDLIKVYEDIVDNAEIRYNVSKVVKFVKANYPKHLASFKKTIWRDIQHYPVEEQLTWLKMDSNFSKVYDGKLKIVPLQVDDLRNERDIFDKVDSWTRNYFKSNRNVLPFINVSLGSGESRVVWHIMAEAGLLPAETRFIKTFDDKSNTPENRFKKFAVREIETNLISSLAEQFQIFEHTKSAPRELVRGKMRSCLLSGFSILLLGERGIGKSRIAEEQKDDRGKRFVEANCASFDEDSKAEAELFGYEKGAFTGANSMKRGLLEEANNGILFLDEIHHLSKLVQAKLMKALQTDQYNRMAIRRMGSNKTVSVSCQLIFASNKTIAELRDCLLPDFYDRIVQHVIEIPSLRENVADRLTDWKSVWRALRFSGHVKAPVDAKLDKWLKTLPLYGNYRDLQKIAMYYHLFTEFDLEIRSLLPQKSAFEYAKSEFEKYHSGIDERNAEKFNFNAKRTTKEMIKDYQFELQDWAVKTFGSRKAAVAHFKSVGDTVTLKTFDNWKSRRSSKKSLDSK